MASVFFHPDDREPGAAHHLAGAPGGPNGNEKGKRDVPPRDQKPDRGEDDSGAPEEDLDLNPFTDFPVRPDDQ